LFALRRRRRPHKPGQRDRGCPRGRRDRLFSLFYPLLGSSLLLLRQHGGRGAKQRHRHSRHSHAARHFGHSCAQLLPTADFGIDVILLLLLFLFILFLLLIAVLLFRYRGDVFRFVIAVILFCEVLLTLSCLTGAGHIGFVSVAGLSSLGGPPPRRMCHTRRGSLVSRRSTRLFGPLGGFPFDGVLAIEALLGWPLGFLLLGCGLGMAGGCLHLLFLQQGQTLLQAHGLRFVLGSLAFVCGSRGDEPGLAGIFQDLGLLFFYFRVFISAVELCDRRLRRRRDVSISARRGCDEGLLDEAGTAGAQVAGLEGGDRRSGGFVERSDAVLE